MKKLISLALSLLSLCLLVCPAVLAEDATPTQVSVTIAIGGKTVVTHQTVSVSDTDGDGALTLSDALFAAHEAFFDGGASAGYNAYMHTDYGLSLGKLWGDDSGNFGYYRNNATAWSLADPVQNGDTVYAFVYTDSEMFSDTYCYFDTYAVSAQEGEHISLTLSMAGYDENWNPVSLPVEGAVLTVDGVKTEIKTNAEGKAVLTLDQAGTYSISAVCDSMTLVPPVCIATVEDKEEETLPATGDAGVLLFVLLGAATLCGVAVSFRRG